MREVVLRVAHTNVEEVLDRLLLLVPGGVREVRQGADVELVMRGDELPSLADIAGTAGRHNRTLFERQTSDDRRERHAADWRPDIIAGKLVARPEWALPATGHTGAQTGGNLNYYDKAQTNRGFLTIADANQKYLKVSGTAANSALLGNLKPSSFVQGHANVRVRFCQPSSRSGQGILRQAPPATS